ncbi:MAG TPA: NUDIX domain-containing protein [Dehalococcoidia bacterium]|nr:NUDIX domain-containing protein [Dehalococcoidia bacterium]
MAPDPEPRVRHLTATGFVVHDGRVLLHWHRKERLWLPFGGHLEANEDPAECCLREVFEECGLRCTIAGSPPPFAFSEPPQRPAPVTILLEAITGSGPAHEHIDLIYFCRPLDPVPATFGDPTIRWLSAAELHANAAVSPAPGIGPATLTEDVRLLSLEALRRAAERR